MATAIDIANRALLMSGARTTISSFNDGSVESNACAALFTPTYESLARTAAWNAFRKQAKLGVLKAASGTPENPQGTTLPLPPTPWLYSYLYPADCILERYIIGSDIATATGSQVYTGVGYASATFPDHVYPFSVAYDTDANGNPQRVILTNVPQAQAVYTVNQPNPAGWDPQFQQAMVCSLAAWLVPALTGNMQMMQMAAQMADRMIGEARTTDGDEGITVVDNIPDFLRCRGYGGGPSYANQSPSYCNMMWPG